MKAVISGQAGAAVVWVSTPTPTPTLKLIGEAGREVSDDGRVFRVFDGCNDVRQITVSSIDELDHLLRLSWGQDRALRLSLFVLELEGSTKDLRSYAAGADKLMADEAVKEFVVRRLSAAPLSNAAATLSVLAISDGLERIESVFQTVAEHQDAIAYLLEAYARIPSSVVGDEHQRKARHEKLVDEGRFLDMALRLKATHRPLLSRLESRFDWRGEDAINRWFEFVAVGPAIDALPVPVLSTVARPRSAASAPPTDPRRDRAQRALHARPARHSGRHAFILLEDVASLGRFGETVRVSHAYARKFLLPNRKALRATQANLRIFAAQRGYIEARNTKAKETAVAIAAELDGAAYVMIRSAGTAGYLYLSVSSREVAALVKAAGPQIDRSMIVLNEPIKRIGVHQVKVRLHADVIVTVTLNVARSQYEAELQALGANFSAPAPEPAPDEEWESGAGADYEY